MPLACHVDQDDRDSTRYVPTLRQGGLGLPDRDYYLKTDDATFAGVRAQVRRLPRDAAARWPATSDVRDARREAMLALETRARARRNGPGSRPATR